MKNILLTLLLLSSFSYAKINTMVSVMPQKFFVESIGGDKINVSLMVKPGNSPHSYTPKPSQMKDIAKADIYFSIGVEFENAWLPRFKSQNKEMKIIDISHGITKIVMKQHSHHEEEHEEHEAHGHDDHADNQHESKDPHIWTSPDNVKVIAKNIYTALVKVDYQNKIYYKKNFDKFINHINQTDKKIKDILSNTKPNSKFMVFHPAWGYFAKQYNLEQFPIEIEGKTPKPKELAFVMEEAREENIKAIFTQPEFSAKSANQIAKELNIKVIKTSPLNYKWSQNLINLAQAIAN
ncbi:MAG: zinc ABC transporter substrate-binding protein [Arcobacteraceae bacterium]|nr:zinc ABC transporter substrate-binding protein [Arcobacteraceae bacterium]